MLWLDVFEGLKGIAGPNGDYTYLRAAMERELRAMSLAFGQRVKLEAVGEFIGSGGVTEVEPLRTVVTAAPTVDAIAAAYIRALRARVRRDSESSYLIARLRIAAA